MQWHSFSCVCEVRNRMLPSGQPRVAINTICSACRRHLQAVVPHGAGLQNSPRIRTLHISEPWRTGLEDNTQAQPLGDFYTDLLATPIPKSSKASTGRNQPTAPSSSSSSSTPLPTFARSGDMSKEERARKLFGDMHASRYDRHVSDRPDGTWQTLHGVPIPPRPAEPDNCCMSGCVHCVWDDYRDDIEQWAGRVHTAQAQARSRAAPESPKIRMPRPEVAEASTSMDDDGGGSEALWQTPAEIADDSDDLFAAIPVGIREFMATEKKLKDRKRARKQRRNVDADTGYS